MTGIKIYILVTVSLIQNSSGVRLNQVHWKLSVQITSSDMLPCHWHWTHSPEIWSDMKILSVSPQQILFPFSGMRQHSFFTSEAGAYTSAWYNITCFPLECCNADNADPIFCALISLPVGLPLLEASTDNKLDLCLGLEDCTGICALHHQTTHTSLVNKGCGETMYSISIFKAGCMCIFENKPSRQYLLCLVP